jgi:hypothetical protein
MSDPKGVLVFYVTAADAPGWMERQLMPSGAFTVVLSQQVWYSDRNADDVVGSRLKAFNGTAESPEPTKSWSPGDWVVESVERYDAAGANTAYSAVGIFHCVYAPIEREWSEVVRGEDLVAV